MALTVADDGSCFFRAHTLLLFCTETFHVEMRCRIAMAMAGNPELFLDGHNWCAEEDQVSPDEILQVALLASVAPGASAAVSLQEEVMSVFQSHNFAGLWEFFAASHVLQRPIQSVYPSLGWPIYKLHCNRIIRAPGCVGSDKLYIMWSSDRTDTVSEHWVPNHFVPVVLRTQTVGVPLRGSFHLIQWNRMEYAGQVRETDELLGVACVSFTSRKPNSNLLFWPLRADLSWESFGSFQEEVSLHLVEEASSQRCQYYAVD